MHSAPPAEPFGGPAPGEPAGTATGGEPVGEVESRVRSSQVKIIYRQSLPAMAISAAVAGIVCYAMWRVTDHRVLVWWWCAVAAIGAVRMALTLRFRARPRDEAEMPRWESYFLVPLVITSLIWGVGGLWVMPRDSVAHQAVVYFFLMGLVGGVVASYAAHPLCVTVSIVSIMLPSTLWFVAAGTTLHRAMAMASVLYLATAVRATHTLSFFLRRSAHLAEGLRAANEANQRLARTDVLTGLCNRRAFYEQGELALTHARRYRHPCSVVALDVDLFKSVNDRWGHAAGDRTLQVLADAMRAAVREVDVVGRMGGEEFAFLLPETTAAGAMIQAERLRQLIARTPVVLERARIDFTVSLGVTEAGEHQTLDRVLARADDALYEAKRAGRNRVVGCSANGEPLAAVLNVEL